VANIGKSPVPLKYMGRYSHEAVAVDPGTSQIYLTEDAASPNGLYYRWTRLLASSRERTPCARWLCPPVAVPPAVFRP
jgi:secreted PhoX family phosphatase